MTLMYFSYNSLIRLNTGISGFHNNTEHSTLNILHFFSLMHEKKKKTWHNSLSFSLSLLQWLEHFSASVKVLLENNVLWTPHLRVEAQVLTLRAKTAFGQQLQLSHLVCWRLLGGDSRVPCAELAAGKQLCHTHLFCTSTAGQHGAYSWARGWPEETSPSDPYLFTFPDTQAKSHHHKMQSHSGRCTAQGGSRAWSWLLQHWWRVKSTITNHKARLSAHVSNLWATANRHMCRIQNGILNCYKSGHRQKTLVFTDRHRRHMKGLEHSDSKTITVL